jgi:hypothetical protein
LDNLGLSTRQANVFRAHNLQRVADLSALGQVGLLMLPNMGYGSVHNLRTQLLDGLESGVGLPPDTDAGTAGQAAGGHTGQVAHNLVAGFKDAAVLLNDAERNVWAGRLGFGCTPMTMQELADAMGLTRERVRQIENQVYRKVERHPFWQELATHLDAALHGRRNALWMTDLPAIDAWFAEAPALATALAGALKRLLSDRFGAIQIEDAWVVSHLRPQEWNEACQSARLMLEAGAKDRIGEGVARWQCDQLLTGRGEELRPILWAQATANALWSARAGQSRRLVSMDSGTESVVIAVLESSDEPLHFTDIHSRACELRASGYDLGSIQNAAHAVAVLFGRGTYGLPDHIPLTSDELVLVRAEVEDLMAGADSGRQWHASEICEALQERGLSFDGKLTKYIVNHALKGNGALVYLRRMVWALGAQWQEGASSRLEVRQAVIDLLEAQGRPMTTPEIRARLAAARGVNQTFQIYPAAPLVRIGTGLWGLLHRDVNVDGAKAVLTRLHEALQARQTGLHLTEIPQVLGLQGDELAAKSAWLPVADGLGISVDRGQYAYITAWGTSRRLAAHEAVEAAVVGVGAEGVDFETICSRVNVLAQRQVPTTHVSVALPDVGMVYDAACRRWKPEASATGS